MYFDTISGIYPYAITGVLIMFKSCWPTFCPPKANAPQSPNSNSGQTSDQRHQPRIEPKSTQWQGSLLDPPGRNIGGPRSNIDPPGVYATRPTTPISIPNAQTVDEVEKKNNEQLEEAARVDTDYQRFFRPREVRMLYRIAKSRQEAEDKRVTATFDALATQQLENIKGQWATEPHSNVESSEHNQTDEEAIAAFDQLTKQQLERIKSQGTDPRSYSASPISIGDIIDSVD